MDRSKAPAQRWFDRRARSYEGGATSRWRDPVQRASLAAFDLTPDDLLLDVGCGTGAASRAASGVAKFVVGVDLSSGMIRRATELTSDVENVRFVADSEQLPVDDGEFTGRPLLRFVPSSSRSSPRRARDGSGPGERWEARHRRCLLGSADR